MLSKKLFIKNMQFNGLSLGFSLVLVPNFIDRNDAKGRQQQVARMV